MFEVYCLTSPSGKSYVGFTSAGADKRWAKHVWDAENGSRLPLHRAIRKYGSEVFTRSLLERMTTEAGAKRAEQLWIKELGTFGSGGYNATLGGEGVFGCKGNIGKKHSPETRAKIGDGNRGKVLSLAARAKISAAAKGRSLARLQTPEIRAKRAAANRGQKRSPETCAKLAEIARNISDETRARMSAAAKLRCARQKLKD
jgi:group I intron endonuclease